MKNILFTILLVTTFTVQAENFFSANITMFDGTMKTGLATIPTNKFLGNSIRFKASENAESVKLKDKKISRIVYQLENGEQHVFENNGYAFVTKKNWEKKLKKGANKSTHWMLITYEGTDISSYIMAVNYYVSNKGELKYSSQSRSRGGLMDTYVLIKTPKYNCAAIVGEFDLLGVVFLEKSFRNITSAILKEESSIVKRIQTKEWKIAELPKLAEAYQEAVEE